MSKPSPPSQRAPRFILRFDDPEHRARLKAQADQAKRSLNKHILFLIEKGEQEQERAA